MQWPVPWQVVSPVAGVGAVYLGIRALMTYRRFGASRFTWVFLVIGVGMSVLLTFASLSLLTMWDVQAEHQECMDRALTVQAEQACTNAHEPALQDRLAPPGQDQPRRRALTTCAAGAGRSAHQCPTPHASLRPTARRRDRQGQGAGSAPTAPSVGGADVPAA